MAKTVLENVRVITIEGVPKETIELKLFKASNIIESIVFTKDIPVMVIVVTEAENGNKL